MIKTKWGVMSEYGSSVTASTHIVEPDEQQEVEPLYICDGPEDNCFNCVGCPCREVHTQEECEGYNLGCDKCRMIDQFVYDEVQKEEGSFGPLDIWGYRILKHAQPSLLLEKFSSKYELELPKSKTIKFKRYADFGNGPKYNHLHDALTYGTSMWKSQQHVGVYYDEAAEIPEGKITGKNPHSETD